MSKILIIGDLHIGARNGSSIFIDYMKNYFNNTLFPYILKNDIKTVIQLGDVLDKRKNIDFLTSAFLIKDFLPFFDEHKIEFISTVGNHDIYYKQSISVSGIEQYTSAYNSEYIKIITAPTEKKIGKTKFTLIPWICEENKEQCINYIQLSVEKDYHNILCGHFELAGFDIQKNWKSKEGSLELAAFSDYDNVFSGHFHTSSTYKNVNYIGTPYMLTWNDYGDIKKFIVYDTETGEYTEVINNNHIFHKVIYTPGLQFLPNPSIGNNQFIKIVITEQDDLFDIYLSKLIESYSPFQYQVINTNDNELVADDVYDISIDDPFSIMIKLVNDMKDIDNDFITNELYKIHSETIEQRNCE